MNGTAVAKVDVVEGGEREREERERETIKNDV